MFELCSARAIAGVRGYDPPTTMILALVIPTILATASFVLVLGAPSGLAPKTHAAQVTVADARIELEGPKGRVGERSASELDLADPRALGAHLIRFPTHKRAASASLGTDELECTTAGGERVRGVLVAQGEESLTIRIVGDARATLALEDVAALRYPARVPASWFAPIERPVEGDRLFRRKGETLERIDGSVEAFSATAIQFHGALVGSLSVPWGDLVALFVESLGGRATAAKTALVPIVVDFEAGTRLRGGLVKLDRSGLLLERRGGDQILCPLEALSLALVEDGVLRYLSNVQASSAPVSTPFGDELGLTWPPRLDLAVTGTPLVAAGKTFARGLGVHAPSRMEWKLDSGVEALRGRVAIDDSALRLATQGWVVFRVLVDGTKRFESPKLRAGDAPVAFSVDGLAGGKVLVLEVDPTSDSFAGDRANWLDLLLVASPSK